MYDDSVFNHPVGSFPEPVPVPSVDPDDPATLVQLCVAKEWVAYMAGSLKQLWLQSTWRTDDPDVLHEAQQRANHLVGMLAEVADGCGIMVPSVLCISGTFADDAYGYVNKTGVPDVSTWVNGTGWESAHLSVPNQDFLSIGRDFTGDALVRSLAFSAHSTPTPRGGHITVTLREGGVDVYTHTVTQTLGTALIFDETPNVTADEIYVECQFDGSPTQVIILDDWSMCYTGVFPLSVRPDTFTHVWDFASSDGGWTGNSGSYGSGGWNATNNSGAPNWYMTLNMAIDATGVRLFSVRVDYTFTQGTHTLNTGDTDGIYDWSPYVALRTNDYRSVPANPYEWVGDHTFAHHLLVQFIAGIKTTNPADGAVKVTKITVTGSGPDPF